MRVLAFINTGFVGCTIEEELEFPDDFTDDEIDEEVHEWMVNHIEWSWKKLNE